MAEIKSRNAFFTVGCGLIVLMTVGLTGAVAQETGKTSDTMTIVYFQPDTPANPIEGNAALQYWGDFVGKEIGKKVITRFFVTLKDFERYLDNQTVQLAIVNPLYIIENYKKRKLVPVVIGTIRGKTHLTRALVVSKARNITSLDQLKGGTIVTTHLGDRTVDFVEKVEFQGKLKIKNFFKDIVLKSTPKQCVNAVMEGTADVAMIPLENYNILKELDPSYNKTSVLLKARKIPIATGVYFADETNLWEVQPFIDCALNLHKTPKGQQSLMVFHIDGLVKASMDEFIELEKELKLATDKENTEK